MKETHRWPLFLLFNYITPHYIVKNSPLLRSSLANQLLLIIT